MSAEKTHPLKQSRERLSTGLLTFAFIATILLRGYAIANKVSITHDEGISYLSATCHQGEYGRSGFGTQPRPAAHWKALFRIDERFCFQQISADLGRSDIHPPLYFWLLHLWALLFGVALWTGPSLNLLIALITTFLLYRFALYLLGNRREAVLATFTYALNYEIIAISAEARQYDLLALWSLLLVWMSIRYAARPRTGGKDALILCLLVLAGGLTHYQFILPVSACALFLVIKLFKRGKRPLIIALASFAVGYVLMFLVHPYFFTALGRAPEGTPRQLELRLLRTAASFGAFSYIIILAVLIGLGVLVLHLSRKLRLSDQWAGMDRSGLWILFFPLWIAAGLYFFYLTFLSPIHAMAPKYLSMIWPFVAFSPVFILRFVRERPSLVMVFYLFPVLISLAFLARQKLLLLETIDPRPVLDTTDLILVDNVERGIFTMIIWHIPDETPVIAADGQELIDGADHWLGQLTGNSLYISQPADSEANQKRILRLIEGEGFEARPSGGEVWDVGAIFTIR